MNAFPALPGGSLIAVVAPAGPVDAERVARVPAVYESLGYRCRLYPACSMQQGYLAGPDEQRLADLHAALADEEVAAIHALRGGYGCLRILAGVDAALVRRARKPLIGYSDLTALHALWAREGVPALHAPMAASDLIRPEREADRQALFDVLRNGLPAGTVLAPELLPGGLRVPGVATGRLIGGNLSLVASLLGTPWAWDAHGALLFLEEVGEATYRVDRLLAHLRLAGVLDAAAGFVLGTFTEADDPAAELRDAFERLGKPVLGGWPSGHGTPNRPLPLGARATLDAAAGTLTLA
ncbi:MAG: LD-carboxypeptidase [Rubrivivax sp.]|nr:LD-carboxypeptidase [Rubrivivax sp.]